MFLSKGCFILLFKNVVIVSQIKKIKRGNSMTFDLIAFRTMSSSIKNKIQKRSSPNENYFYKFFNVSQKINKIPFSNSMNSGGDKLAQHESITRKRTKLISRNRQKINNEIHEINTRFNYLFVKNDDQGWLVALSKQKSSRDYCGGVKLITRETIYIYIRENLNPKQNRKL